MAVCFFDKNYNNKYNCEYEITKNGIQVLVEYEINDEITRKSNGMLSFGFDTKFRERDILIIDYKNKMNYLLKDAYYSGHKNVFGTPDNSFKTNFFSECYFYDKDYKKLTYLLKTPKVKKIRLYSNIINELIGHPSLYEESLENEFVIKLQKETTKEKIHVGKNNIRNLIISDDWNHHHNYKNNDIIIKLNGYIEIEVQKRVDYNIIHDYIKEIMIYLQLLRPDKLQINKITVSVEDLYYGFFIPINQLEYKNSYVKNSVTDTLSIFLSNCYNFMPYRESKNEVRNIPYIILETSRNIEDNFLTFYKFIECYYKRQNIKKIENIFIKYSIENNYNKSKDLNINEIENLAQEIICLRNQYVHSGYYLKNNCLKVKFKDKGDKLSNKKNYTVNNVNFEWIYERTRILYDIVIDIIFRKMLNYEDYDFSKHF